MKTRLGIMAYLILIMLLVLTVNVQAVEGSWSSSGNVIYYNDGNVGVGTSSPRNKFDVMGDAVIGRSDGSLFVIQTPATETRLYTSGGKPIVFPQGNIGIGTTVPQNKLHVEGDVIFGRSGGTNLYFQTPTTDARIYAQGGKPILFPQGNIGIGTYSPTHRLSVNGTIKAKEIIVSNSGWADYVFEDDYKLMSIKDLDAYIKTHKHLPNIPNATEVEENGVQLGEVQRLQLEKIEELTLYIIELEKRVEQLEAKL